jgi:hypothetical protein
MRLGLEKTIGRRISGVLGIGIANALTGRSSVMNKIGVIILITLMSICIPQATSIASQEASQTPPTALPRSTTPVGPTRTEKDLLGEKQIPSDAHYGVQTARALEKFQISGIPINHYPAS